MNPKNLQQLSQWSSFVKMRQRLKYEHPYPLGTLKADTAGLLTTGENVVREKYGEITSNPPLYPGHNNPE